MSRIRTVMATGTVCALLTLAATAQQPAVTRIYSESTPGIVLPTVVSRENPTYTRAALDASLAGETSVDVTVDVDGRVRDVLLVKSVDAVHGLGQAGDVLQDPLVPVRPGRQPTRRADSRET